MQTNNQLLERYAQGGSQYAFQELVERHINLVHSAALRESLGDVSRAEDITQAVFVELARQANRLVAHPALSGWLYTCVRRMTANVRRSEQRRQRREQESFTMSKILEPDPLDTLWQEVRPELDNVMHELAEKDRTAVVLRYFEGRTLKEVGLALGLTENAARMRLERSLEKLRLLLSKRGVKSTASTLATALTAGAVLTAPSILATKVVSAAMTEVTRETTAFSMERILRFLKTKPMIAGMVLALLGGLIGSRSLSGSASTRIVAKVETNSPTVSAAPVLNKQDVVTDASSSPAPSQMLVQVIETETGKPLSRAKAHLFYIRQDGRGETSKGLAGADGIIPVEGIRKPFRGLNMFISAAGHVPRVATWGFGVDMPAEYTMKLEKATTVGGIVVDEFSKPISGATLSFHCRIGSYVTADHIGFGPDTNTRTDEDGRWSCNMVPQDLQNLDIDVTHPLFAKSSVVLHPSSAQANHFTITLSSGIDFKGTVTDIGGNPIESARIREVFIHSDTGRSTVTDKMGNFELLHLKPGEVTLVAEAEAYAAAVQTVQSTASVAALRFQLGPGKVIRGRVSDEEGNAIAGAFVETSRGRNKIEWSTTTDASGRFEWNSAPTEPLLYSFQAEEFNRAYAIPLPADGSEHLITLTREHLDQDMIRIQGTVSDAESGKPIDAFNVLQSDIEADAAFPFDFRTIGKNGTFSFSVRADSNHPKFQLQIETPGYRPAVSPEYFRKDGNQTITFKLRKAGPIEGIVLLPDGAPAENASVFLCTSRAGVVIDGPARVGTGLNITPNRAQTDKTGKFSIQVAVDPSGWIIIHDQGYLEVSLAEMERAGSVTLKPWGKVQGTLLLNSKVVANERIVIANYIVRYTDTGRRFGFSSLYLETQTDGAGKFFFDKVPPGECQVFRQTLVNRTGFESHETSIMVNAGEVTEVKLGGSGRTIVGKAVVRTGTEQIDWRNVAINLRSKTSDEQVSRPKCSDFNSTQSYIAAQERFFDVRSRRRYGALCNRDGSFCLPDVPPGTYEISIHLQDLHSFESNDSSNIGELASIRRIIVIPESQTNQTEDAIDLGILELETAH